MDVDAPDIRLIFTNDLFGGFEPAATSWGQLPGATALRVHVDRLRDGATSARWIDGGDFSAGGSIAPATRGVAGWAAAATLGFDAAVPGNHEFDYGDEVYAERVAGMPFPILAADVPGATDHLVFSSPDGHTSAAVIGLCFAERRGLRVFDRETDLDEGARRLLAVAHAVRAQVDHVIAVVHEGVPKPPEPDSGRLSRFCAAVSEAVDVVVGGHTLSRQAGLLGGVPYLQPWAFGCEVAVVDLHGPRRRPRLERVPSHADWAGPGADLLHALETDIVGNNHAPLSTPATTGATSFERAVAQGLLRVSDAAAALVLPTETGCVQPALDGVFGHLPAGPVSAAQLFRCLPWPEAELGDRMWAARLSDSQLNLLTGRLADHFPGFGLPGVAARARAGTTLISGSYVGLARAMVPDVEWECAPVGLRDGLRAWVGAGESAASDQAHRFTASISPVRPVPTHEEKPC